MDMAAAKMIGAGLAMLALLGVGIGLGNIFSNLITAIARNPSAKDDVMKVGLIGFALTESIALLAFVTALIILSK
ncbi:MAG: synthase subunit [Alphaproteobacteria bacterium]|jgi:F0F1-type ATP synthase membrane subunit c/vacuolar-type H+-ATPase subunit K|nr:synthase subunit [Alphaproteobacteria bacterium]MDF3034522.1 synthase subunit [Alphaproteobacteria bacterium]